MTAATRSTCAVYVYREGALAAVGHDLKLVVGELSLEMGEGPSVQATARTGSLRVAGVLRDARRGTVDESEPSPGDRREIERNATRDVLEADRYPLATFRSTSIEAAGTAGNDYRISGVLELHGVTRPVELTAERQGGRLVARLLIHQPDFRIKPYRALLGALRVKPEVLVEILTEVPELPATTGKRAGEKDMRS